MAIIEPSHIGHTPFQQLLGHHEDIMKTWSALSDTLENTNALNAELKEEIRRMLAQKNGCQYCKAKGKPTGSLTDENQQYVLDLQKSISNWEIKYLQRTQKS